MVLWGGDNQAEALSIAAGMRRNTRLYHIPALLYLKADSFVTAADGPPFWPTWLPPLQARWEEVIRLPADAPPRPWFLEEALTRGGAFATFLGVVLEPCADGPAQRVRQHFLGEAADETALFRQERLLELLDRLELAAAGQHAADVEQRRVRVVAEAFAVLAVAPGADCVVVLQRDAERVDL